MVDVLRNKTLVWKLPKSLHIGANDRFILDVAVPRFIQSTKWHALLSWCERNLDRLYHLFYFSHATPKGFRPILEWRSRVWALSQNRLGTSKFIDKGLKPFSRCSAYLRVFKTFEFWQRSTPQSLFLYFQKSASLKVCQICAMPDVEIFH